MPVLIDLANFISQMSIIEKLKLNFSKLIPNQCFLEI